MTGHRDPLDPLFDALLDVEGHWHIADLDLDGAVELWLGLTHARSILDDLIKTIADDASSRLLDRDDPREVYVTSTGSPVHLAPGYAPERWRGHDVLFELAVPSVPVDLETGEMGSVTQAVPVEVLVDVLPGCATPDLTSSKWRVTGLKRWLDDWYRYRSKDDAPLTIKRGEPRP